jgi:hypothetical protein
MSVTLRPGELADHGARLVWFAALALFSCSAMAQEPPDEAMEPGGALGFWQRIKSRTYVSGTIESESAVELRDGAAQKFETILQPDFEVQIGEEWDLTFVPRLRFDPVDRLYPGRPEQPERSGPSRIGLIGDPLEAELRELYVRTEAGDNAYLTIGKQQVVWGKADGLKVLDVVNPQDFREFVLDEFDDSRIPLWMFNAEFPIKNTTLQVLWIPDLTYHDLPEEGSPFEFTSQVPDVPDGVTLITEDPNRPNNPMIDSDFGLRLSGFAKGWDFTINYLYHYDDIPALYRTIDVSGPTPVVTVSPEYERSHLIGGTFSTAIGELTLRGELGYSTSRFFPTEDATDTDGVIESGDF